jgi:hypothetical protein
MGRELGKAVLTRGRAAVLGVLVAGAFGGPLVAAPAYAADPTPSPNPTPSVSPPTQQQIDDAKAALKRLRNQGKATPTTLTQVAGPTGGSSDFFASRISGEAWWTLGAGLLVLVVASETTRLSVRRAKHRKEA